MLFAWNIGLISQADSKPSADSVHLYFSHLLFLFSHCWLLPCTQNKAQYIPRDLKFFCPYQQTLRVPVCLYWREKGPSWGWQQIHAPCSAQMSGFSVLSLAFTRLAVPVVQMRSHSFSALPSLFLVSTREASCRGLARAFLCLRLLWTQNHCTSS